MKTSNKTNIITGAVLLLLAAAFTISLLLQLLNFGVGGPGHDNFVFILGNILYTVYGFSSLWIPVFLLITGLSCFATKWTAKRTVRLLTAIVPFFTSVITENICRSILKLESSSFPVTKFIISLVIGIMLMIIEFLFAGIIADRVNDSYYKITKQPKPDSSQKLHPDNLSENKDSKVNFVPISSEKLKNFETNKTIEEKNTSTEESPFDAAISTLNFTKASQIPETETQNNPVEIQENKAETHTEISKNEEDDEDPATPASIITQEEFAALIQPDFIEDEKISDEPPVEEIEWTNVPPKPDKLPPEYDENYEIEEFTENDKSLEFPPKDYEEVNESNKNKDMDFIEDSFISEEESSSNQSSQLNHEEITEDFQEESDLQFIKEANNLENELLNEIENKSRDEIVFGNNFSDDFVLDDSDFNEEDDVSEEEYESVLFENSSNQQENVNFRNEEDNFSESENVTVKYVDKVIENPSYPYGIQIHKENLNSKNSNTNKQVKDDTLKPTYPTTINLTQEKKSETKNNINNPQQKPIEIFENSNEDFNYYKEDEIQDSKEIESPSLESNLSQNQLDEIQKEKQVQARLNSERIIKQRQMQFQEQAKKANSGTKTFSSFASNVFSDMENDILGNNSSETTESEFENEVENNISNENQFTDEIQSPSQDANDLTSDDLTSFFNAQEEENAPRTKEIQGNPPKTNNRAAAKGPYVIPSDLLTAYKDDQYWLIDDATKQASMNLKQTLAEFNIEAKIIGIKKGPVVTMFELLPAPGVKLSKIVALQDNIALSLAASSVRIVAPIPGKQAVGIEVPNKNRSIVGFREIIEMPLPEWDKMAVPVILGKDILGKPQLIDLVKTPHMLIAGATGSGKSVCVNSLILSILYKRSYKDVKLILVDPKVVELKLYNNIPHLLTPVITEPKKAFQALQYCLCEMERRYALLDGLGVRDISTYNQRIKERNICTEKLPYIVVIIDEFADLMATTGRELESVVARLTAMSRAVGIHLVLATQRPSVNVITGLIKANIPSRIAFMVASRTDSNIIIDSVGAEKLLGRGDMLYTSAVDPYPVRIQGTFVSDQEVENVVNCVKEFGEPDYIDDEIFVEDDDDMGENVDLFGNSIDEDPLYDQALEIVVQAGKASASYIQRRLKIGYNRAARLVEEMEERGIVGPANGSKPREIIHMP